MSKQIFTKFPELPAKLQVAIIGYALDENIKRRDNKLTIYYNIQGGFRNRELKHRGVRLPQLPAIYHVNRLFRAEAVRAHPIYQLFDGTPEVDLVPGFETGDQCGSMVVFDAACDTFEVIFQVSRHALKGLRLKLLFQLMAGSFKTCIQRIRVEMVVFIPWCPQLVVGTLWDPEFLALLNIDVKLIRVEPYDGEGHHKYTLKNCGAVVGTGSYFFVENGLRTDYVRVPRIWSLTTAIEKINFAEKRRLQVRDRVKKR